ncbi:MAG TPA: hypothetical protein VGM56_19700 [Byssovorax sp.]|jgi:hypothetical protein
MLIQNLKVFDDYVSPTTVTLSSDRWNAALGRCSAIHVTSVIDDIGPTGTGTFDLWLIESSDNRNWFLRTANEAALSNNPGTGDIKIPSLASGAQYVRTFADACRGITLRGSTITGPLLPFIRISVYTTVVRARVQVHVACRGPAR